MSRSVAAFKEALRLLFVEKELELTLSMPKDRPRTITNDEGASRFGFGFKCGWFFIDISVVLGRL